MLGSGPVIHAGPYEGMTMDDLLEQDPWSLLDYMESVGYHDPLLKNAARAAIEYTDTNYINLYDEEELEA